MNNTNTEKTIQTYNKLGQQYLDDCKDLMPPELPLFISMLPAKAAVLDVGCAGGRDTALFAAAGHDVIGIDLSEVFLNIARKQIPEATFKKMDVRDLQFSDETFDAVWANAILLHIEKRDIPETLSEFRRVLKPNGLLHIRIKEGDESKFVIDTLSQNTERHFIFYTEEEIVRFITDAEFTIHSRERIKDEVGRENLNWIRVWAKRD